MILSQLDTTLLFQWTHEQIGPVRWTRHPTPRWMDVNVEEGSILPRMPLAASLRQREPPMNEAEPEASGRDRTRVFLPVWAGIFRYLLPK